MLSKSDIGVYYKFKSTQTLYICTIFFGLRDVTRKSIIRMSLCRRSLSVYLIYAECTLATAKFISTCLLTY